MCAKKGASVCPQRTKTANSVAYTSEDVSSNVRGQRFVIGLYAALVTVAGVAGFLTGTFVSGLQPPKFLFLVPFPATPLGFAAYGALTIALVLGLPLLLVVYVSSQIDDVAG
ncbi:cox cluster protein [Haloferax elongans ATCC BAA-1513]|uniref:Cox cluster protein n=1 Tax=Haloferax elongans ATCC BAA-1513 TaxID=1230453 RepID=M0HS06_HALEO|nr:cox cluster protein [Haloferax elongans ATCC BAA-1513]